MGQQRAECEVGLQAGGVTDQNVRHVRGKFPDALSATTAGGAQLASITTGNGNFDDLCSPLLNHHRNGRCLSTNSIRKGGIFHILARMDAPILIEKRRTNLET